MAISSPWHYTCVVLQKHGNFILNQQQRNGACKSTDYPTHTGVDNTYLNQALISSWHRSHFRQSTNLFQWPQKEILVLWREWNVINWLPGFVVLVISDACVIPIRKPESVPILINFPTWNTQSWLCGSSDMHRNMLQSYLLAQLQEFVWPTVPE